MLTRLKQTQIYQAFQILDGNTRAILLAQPFWSFPYSVFNFYLSLYMKRLGVTNEQIGYIISLGFVFSIFFALIGGFVVDRFGRRYTLLVTDMITWPVCLVFYLTATGFTSFLVGAFFNSFMRIAGVAYNLSLAEDATPQQRVAVYNFLGIINISSGVVVPLAGFVIARFDFVLAERIFLAISVASIAAMIIFRHFSIKETKVGRQLLEQRRQHQSGGTKPANTFRYMLETFRNRDKRLVVAIMVVFNLVQTLSAVSSMYFAPYMTEVIGFSPSSISMLSVVYSLVSLLVFLFINPKIGHRNISRFCGVAFALEMAALCILILTPRNYFFLAGAGVTVFSLGIGVGTPLVNTLFANSASGGSAAAAYATMTTALCVCTAMVTVFSGNIYAFNPRILFGIAAVLALLGCLLCVANLKRDPSTVERERKRVK